MFHQIFGAENAADDDLLEECYEAPPGVVLDRPILVGKWGAGKTGLLLHRNAALSRELRKIDPTRDRIWYLDETGIQLQTLKHIEQICGQDPHLTKRLLEDLWKSEIVRTAATVLITLYDYYEKPTGDHWTHLLKLLGRASRRSVWEMLPSALGLVMTGERVTSVHELTAQLKSLHDDTTLVYLQKCLRDIESFAVQPTVVIEPIETPSSPVEEETNLAELLVTCLLNVYYKHFRPSSRQRIRVEVSIPWHRYQQDQIGEPQKLFPFMGRFHWTKGSLRSFINKRIEWEFRRVRRSFVAKGTNDAWSALFPDTVRNSNTGEFENSFDYIVRHTQYRVRDLLRLARESLEHEAVGQSETVADVLIGRGGQKISEKSVRAAIVKACKRTAAERVVEGSRKYPDLQDYVESLRGIAVPFATSDLKRRFERRDKPIDFSKAMAGLWNAGIIGVQIIAHSEQAGMQLQKAFESGTRRANIGTDGSVAVHYVFEYATDKNAMDIINTFDGTKAEHNDISVRLVVHPMMFEYLDARINETHAIGV